MIFTTSWDDGHPFDMRIAQLLTDYGFKGTFYVPLLNSENDVMSKKQIYQLSKFHEIGGHTINHTYLNKLSIERKKEEIFNSKKILEDIIGKQISAFCFPGGHFSNIDIKLIKEAGFLFGRTTELFQTKINKDSLLLPTTLQLYNHNTITYLKHCLKRKYFKEMIDHRFFLKNHSILNLTKFYLENNIGDFIHIWGHSWEIEKYNLWRDLESLFKIIALRSDVTYLNNTEIWKSFH